jgi:hypothetical protein
MTLEPIVVALAMNKSVPEIALIVKPVYMTGKSLPNGAVGMD